MQQPGGKGQAHRQQEASNGPVDDWFTPGETRTRQECSIHATTGRGGSFCLCFRVHPG